jgi:hypothetical protein
MRILYRGRLSTAGQSMKQTIPPPLRSASVLTVCLLGFALGACGSGENRVTAGNRDGVAWIRTSPRVFPNTRS